MLLEHIPDKTQRITFILKMGDPLQYGQNLLLLIKAFIASAFYHRQETQISIVIDSRVGDIKTGCDVFG